MKYLKMVWCVVTVMLFVVLPSNAAQEWRVKPYQNSTTRNTVSESVAVGTTCADVVMWRSPTGKVEYRAVSVTRGGLTVNLPVECELVTVPDPVPPPAPPPTANVIFSDDFSSGNLTKTQNGFRWEDQTRTAVVVSPNGTPALRLSYQGVSSGQDSFTEQRFYLGARHTELWIKYDLYVPSNFVHRNEGNNKSFIHLWAGDYGGGPGLGYGFEVWPRSTGFGELTFHRFRPDTYHREDEVRHPQDFTAADRGTWVEIVVHVKPATSATSNDGFARIYKKPQGGARALHFELTGLDLYNGQGNYVERGYLLGWANSGFAQQTDFYIDNIVFSTSPL